MQELAEHLAAGEGEPTIGHGRPRQRRRDEGEPGDVGQEMVGAAFRIKLEMGEDVPRVIDQAAFQRLEECRVEVRAGGSKEVEPEDPIRGPDRHLHRAPPVDAEARRIRGDEIEDLVAPRATITIVARQRESPGERRQMLHPRELPRHLDVDAGQMADRHVRRPAQPAPAPARLDIALPVDGRDSPA